MIEANITVGGKLRCILKEGSPNYILKAIMSIMKLLTGDSKSLVYHDGKQFNNMYWTSYNISIYIQVYVLYYSLTPIQVE